ncbi:MAG TPA: DeoR/GlpR family DNA-binding transcription regulator [Bryobacteraceae bacterium]|jgi:DeoR/GlpR family transcriptional regulator of sugar metabolism|nr:DeoR/GlpR family DNA-binding transcription regulator [Bryobacteraceae bacterium]
MSKRKPDRMLAEERRREILRVLGQNGRVTVEEIAQRFGVSSVTARGDLDMLSEAGALVRSHGGGLRPLTAKPEHALRVREGIHHEEKQRIAHAALQLIEPWQTVILCTGSTSAELAAQLARNCPEHLTVITYALNVASILQELPDLSLVMIGGILRSVSSAFVGPQAEQMMDSLHADHCFLSTVGLDADIGLTTLDIMEAQLNRRMMSASAQVTVLADSSKFGRRSANRITGWDGIRRVITDTGAPEEDIAKLRTRGIEVVCA